MIIYATTSSRHTLEYLYVTSRRHIDAAFTLSIAISVSLSLFLSSSLFLTLVIVKRAEERNDSSAEMFSVSRFYRRKLARGKGE